jgi:hypothetical protein
LVGVQPGLEYVPIGSFTIGSVADNQALSSAEGNVPVIADRFPNRVCFIVAIDVVRGTFQQSPHIPAGSAPGDCTS